MKESAPARELQSPSDWKVLVPAGTEGPLLLTHAISDPYLTFCSEVSVHKAAVPSFPLFLLGLLSALHWIPFRRIAAWSAFSLPLAICLPALWRAAKSALWNGCLDALCRGAWTWTNLSWSMVLAPLKGAQRPSVLGLAKIALRCQLTVVFLLFGSCRWYCSDVRWVYSMNKILPGGIGNASAFILGLKSPLGWNMTWSQSAPSSVCWRSHPEFNVAVCGARKKTLHSFQGFKKKQKQTDRSSVLLTWKT